MQAMSSEQAVGWEALKKARDEIAPTAVSVFNEEGSVAPQLFAMRMGASGELERATPIDPRLVAEFLARDDGKDSFSALLKALLDERDSVRAAFASAIGWAPNVLVQVNEAWMSVPQDPEHMVAPSEDPNRRECVMVVVHSRFGSVPVMHEVSAGDERVCTLSAFPALSSDWQFGGRFSMQEAFRNDAGRAGLH